MELETSIQTIAMTIYSITLYIVCAYGWLSLGAMFGVVISGLISNSREASSNDIN